MQISENPADTALTPLAARSSIGLTGGTFDPIHFGHLRMAQELAESLNLNEVRFIPAASPPHKASPQVNAEHRVAMVALGIAGNALFSLDQRELQRAGASYTIDTLLSLRAELGADVSLVLLLGSDAFSQFNRWQRWQEIIQHCHIALAHRPGAANSLDGGGLAKELETFLGNHYTENAADLHSCAAGFVTMQSVTALDISSTAIRAALQQKHSVRYLLPDSVIDYIATHQLYAE
jgi:nicotinate-nucleotide adenylyltransferase